MNPQVTVGQTVFANPVLAASGTFEFGLKFPAVANRLGGVATKAITLAPRVGNPPPRIHEFPGGILNSVGLENPGLETFCREVVPRMRKLLCRIVVNIAGFTEEEYGELAARLDQEPIDALEVNVSCPNVKEGGALFGQQPRVVETITSLVRRQTRKTVVVKLTANFADPLETAKAAEAGGADGVTLINTLFGLALNRSGRPFLGGRNGGMSGPALKPFALFCVDRVAAAVKVPIVGCGGIMDYTDALDFLSAGARMVQVGSANLVNPQAALEVWTGLRSYARKKRLKDWGEIVGRTRVNQGQRDKETEGQSVRTLAPLLPRPPGPFLSELLRQSGVLREGHFLLTSGRHSDKYFEKFRILEQPPVCEAFAGAVAERFRSDCPTVVCGPTTGGIIIAYEVARQLGCRCVIAEKSEAGRKIGRGFRLAAEDRVLVVDDVLTTGGSIRETMAAVASSEARVIGVGVYVDRSAGVDFSVPLFGAYRQQAATYEPGACPLCAKGIALEEPGRSGKK